MTTLLHSARCTGELPTAAAVDGPASSTTHEAGPVASPNACPRCTFDNGPGAVSCVMCQLELQEMSESDLLAAATNTRAPPVQVTDARAADVGGGVPALASAPPLVDLADDEAAEAVRAPDPVRRERLVGGFDDDDAIGSSGRGNVLPGVWTCTRCTMENMPASRSCEACGYACGLGPPMHGPRGPSPCSTSAPASSSSQSRAAPRPIVSDVSGREEGAQGLGGAALGGLVGGLYAFARGQGVVDGAVNGAMWGGMLGLVGQTMNDIDGIRGGSTSSSSGSVSSQADPTGQGPEFIPSMHDIMGLLQAGVTGARQGARRRRGGAQGGGRPEGMSRRRIEQFPTSPYVARTNSDGEIEEDCCQVCLERFNTGDEVRTLGCLHRYHPRCVDEWLGRSASCPICKTDFSQ